MGFLLTSIKDQRRILRLGARAVLPAVALAVFMPLLWHKFAALDAAAVGAALRGLTPLQLGLSLLFTALSLRAVGLYDALMHRVLDSPVPQGRARRAGTRAIALSQTLGLGTLTGAVVRWRLLPELSLAASMRLSVLVSLSFIGAMAVVTALVLPLSGLSPLRAGWMIPLGLGVALALLALAFAAHRLGWLPRPLEPTTISQLVGATLLDTGCAAAALWVLWPTELGFGVIFAAYLLALGAGLLSNAPGGVGAFDLTMLALLPAPNTEPLLAALLAFRVIYYALPACLALLTLIRPQPPSGLRDDSPTQRPGDPPEAGLALQSAALLHDGSRRYLTLRAPYTLAIKGPAPALAPLLWRAEDEGRSPVLYQCDGKTAAEARAHGWHILHIAQEALIDPQTWCLTGPAHRQLRRKLRGVEKAGVTIRAAHDLAALAPVAARWAVAHGGEKGLSMGRFDIPYMRRQQVFVAFDGPKPIAFVSFHVQGARWTLDLMRHDVPVPAGTMHALIVHALQTAQAKGATTFSLANVLSLPETLPFAKTLLQRTKGLRQFKSAFGPVWQPRYAAAPNRFDLALSLAALSYAIHRPPPLPGASVAHHQDARFSFETPADPCHSLRQHSPIAGARPHDQRPVPPA